MASRPYARVVFSFRDERDKGAHPEAKHTALDIAAVKSDADVLASRLAAASECALVSYTINYSEVVEMPVSPGPEMVQSKAVLVFQCADETYYALEIPGIKEGLAAATPPVVDIDTMVAEMQAIAAGLIAQGFTNEFGAALVRLDNVGLVFHP